MHSTTLAVFLFTQLILAGTSRTAAPQNPPAQAAPAKKWTQSELEALSREIQGDLEKLRGEKFTQIVPVKISTKADLVAYMKMQQAKTDPPAKLAADEQIAKLLGVVSPELDMQSTIQALLESQVAGFYDPDTKSFSLMESLPVALTKITLAHELDHALDDQLFDLDTHMKAVSHSSDVQLAFQSVAEGSGIALMYEWLVNSDDPMSLAGSVSKQQQQELLTMAGAPAWFWKPLLGCYVTGGAFLLHSDNWIGAQTALLTKAKTVSSADIRTAFESAPRSCEQILHPEKYWDASQRDEPRAIHFDASKLADGWQVLREDTLGEFLIAIVATPPVERDVDLRDEAAILGMKFTNDVARGWGGDRLVLLGKDDARVLRWVTVWDTDRDAGEFFGALTQLLPSFESAASALSGDKAKDSGATLEYGAKNDEVVLTIRSRTSRADLKRLLKNLPHSL